MSGGSMDYLCWKMENEAGMFEDREIMELMNDLAKVAHDCEWYHSGDICRETYMNTVRLFKEKWFKGDRTERLKGYVDESFDRARRECMELLGLEVVKDE